MINEPETYQENYQENEKLWWEELMDQYPFIVGIEPNSDPICVPVYFIFGGKLTFEKYWGTERPNTKEQIISYCKDCKKKLNQVVTKMIYGD